jgi:Tfp pilus assembly ATPase PilU
MQTFDQALIQRVEQGIITMDEAIKVASNPADIKLQANTMATTVPGV